MHNCKQRETYGLSFLTSQNLCNLRFLALDIPIVGATTIPLYWEDNLEPAFHVGSLS